jgi:hypothetical protein
MYEGECPFEAMCGQLRAERLTGVDRIDHQGLAGKILLFILFGINPLFDPFYLFGRRFNNLFNFKS